MSKKIRRLSCELLDACGVKGHMDFAMHKPRPNTRAVLAASALLAATMVAVLAPVDFAQTAPAAPAATSLRRLTDAELLDAFVTVGRDAGATDAGLSQGSPSMYDTKFADVKLEILRRGNAMTPGLLDMLRTEAMQGHPAIPGTKREFGLLQEEVALLNALDDPGEVKPLLDLLSQDTARRRPSFLRTLGDDILPVIERITYTTFRTMTDTRSNTDMVLHPDALPGPYRSIQFPDADFPRIIALYTKWLDGEGKDAATWLSLAQARARQRLNQDNDLNAMIAAAQFLSSEVRVTNYQTDPPSLGKFSLAHDDAPERTVQRLIQVLNDIKTDKPAGRFEGRYQGRVIDIRNWVGFLASYGEQARPAADRIIALHKDGGHMTLGFNWLDAMARINGPQIMTYFAELLPEAQKGLDSAPKVDVPPIGGPSGRLTAEQQERRKFMQFQVQLRFDFDLSAGRVFDSDEDRIRWWAANKAKSPEQWLRDSQPEAARRADASGMHSDPPALAGAYALAEISPPRNDIVLFRRLYPDAPFGTDEIHPYAPRTSVSARGTTPLPFRAQWIKDHQPNLKYDATMGALRLTTRY